MGGGADGTLRNPGYREKRSLVCLPGKIQHEPVLQVTFNCFRDKLPQPGDGILARNAEDGLRQAGCQDARPPNARMAVNRDRPPRFSRSQGRFKRQFQNLGLEDVKIWRWRVDHIISKLPIMPQQVLPQQALQFLRLIEHHDSVHPVPLISR